MTNLKSIIFFIEDFPYNSGAGWKALFGIDHEEFNIFDAPMKTNPLNRIKASITFAIQKESAK